MDSTEFAKAGDLAFAAVAVDGALAGGRGATASSLSNAGNNTYTVTFDKDVSKCSFTANAVGASSNAGGLGVAPASPASRPRWRSTSPTTRAAARAGRSTCRSSADQAPHRDVSPRHSPRALVCSCVLLLLPAPAAAAPNVVDRSRPTTRRPSRCA